MRASILIYHSADCTNDRDHCSEYSAEPAEKDNTHSSTSSTP